MDLAIRNDEVNAAKNLSTVDGDMETFDLEQWNGHGPESTVTMDYHYRRSGNGGAEGASQSGEVC